MTDERTNVIHVTFGRDGSHRIEPPAVEPAASKPTATPGTAAEVARSTAQPTPVDDPLADLYDPEEVARFFGISVKRLRAWQKRGLAEPSVERGSRRFYTFRDLVGLRAVKGLLESGVPEKTVQRSVEALRKMLPRVSRPLTELRVQADGGSLVVIDDRGSYEPSTGQQVLDFSVDALRDDVVRVLRRPVDAEARKSAYEHYLEGCRYDEDPQTMERAAEAYVAAIRLDPALSCAITNLGNLRYRQSRIEDAERLYHNAIAIDDEQPEAHYNLGFIELERGNAKLAVSRLERALELDPTFADAHFNLASAYEAVGRGRESIPHWDWYLELEPEGTWASLARTRLAHWTRSPQ